MQFAAGLTDRQAAEAVRGRIDWKYAMGLKLTDPGFDFSVLSSFRRRLVEGAAEHLLLERLLTAYRARATAGTGPATDGLDTSAGRPAGGESTGSGGRDALPDAQRDCRSLRRRVRVRAPRTAAGSLFG